MKFSIATGILVQTLPVISSEHSSSHRLTHDDDDTHTGGFSRFLATLLQKDQHTKATTKSHGNTAKNAHGELLRNRHSFGKPLMNPPRRTSTATKNGCNPLSPPDGDIGILACGRGYECVASESSGFGGVCMPITSRDLQEGNDACDLCPMGRVVGRRISIDVVDDFESGFGGETCAYVANAAYNNKTIDAATCPRVAEAVQASGCCQSKCDLCGVGFQASSSDVGIGVWGIPLPGYDFSTCTNLYYAAYLYATISPANCPSIRQATIAAGCCSRRVCYVCGQTSVIDEEYSAGTTCADLKTAAYLDKSILQDDCPAAIQQANDEGCCTPPPTKTGDCNICGNVPFYPDNWVFKKGSCADVQYLLDDTACARYSSSLAYFCCGPPPKVTDGPVATPGESSDETSGGNGGPSPASPDKPTVEPVSPPPLTAPSSPPPSASMTAGSTGLLVVCWSTMMGLALVTAATFVY